MKLTVTQYTGEALNDPPIEQDKLRVEWTVGEIDGWFSTHRNTPLISVIDLVSREVAECLTREGD
jgi:hypothetical protein